MSLPYENAKSGNHNSATAILEKHLIDSHCLCLQGRLL